MKAVSSDEILLTGATGVLGGHLLKELLQTTTARLHCLVRAETPEAAKQRLLTFLKVYDPKGECEEEFNRRVVPVSGDVSKEKLGLSESEYQALAEKIDVTIHVAANTNLFLSFRRIEPVNVGGTRNIIEFCLKTPNKYLCHVSTHTVMGSKAFDTSLVFKETDLDIGQNFDNLAYQESKFIGEKLVREAGARGLVWNIFRPGQIFGESTTGIYPHGHSNIAGLFYDLLKTAIDINTAYPAGIHFDVVPVDYVSRALLALGLKSRSFFETYHLTNPDVKTYHEVIQLLTHFGYRIAFISQPEYEKKLFNRELKKDNVEYKSSTISAFKWWFKRGMTFNQGGYTDCRYTHALAQKHGVTCAPADIELMKIYVEDGIRNGYFPRPPRATTRQKAGAEAGVFA